MARIWDEVVDYRQTAEFCRLLGVREDADFEDITKAYRQKALKCHPDKNPDDPQATAKFQELSKAYQHLRDLKKEQDEDFQSEEAWEYFDEEDDPESFAEFLFFLVLRDLYRNGYQPSERDEYRFFTRLNKKFRRYRTEDEDFTEEELQRLHCNKDYIKDKAPGKKKRGKKKVQQDKPPQNVQNRPKKTKKQLKAEQYRREQMRMKTALNIPDAKSPKGTPSTADQCTIEDLQDEASSVIDTDVRRAKLEAFKAKCLATKAQKEQDVQLPKQVVPEDTRPTDESKPSSHADVSHPSATGQGFRAPKPQIQLSVERQPELTHTWTNQQKKGQHNHEEWQELRRVMLQREKEREQQRNRQEQETLRREKTLPHGAAKEWPDPSVNTDATQEQWEDAGASSGQAALGMASGYNHSSQPLGERCQSEGSRMVHEEVWEESGWEDCVQHQAPPAAQAWRNTKPAPPPAVNRWQERLELMSLCPRTEQDEEEMLRKAIELSQQQAVEDEHRRQVKFEKMIEEQKRKYNVFPSNSAQSRRAEPYYNGASDEDFPPISNGASTVVRQAGTSFATCLRQSKTECQEHLPRSHVGMCVPVSEDWESDLTEVVSHPPLMKDAREPCKPMQRPGSAVSSRKIPANPKLHNTSTEQSLESPDDNATEKTTWLLSGESVSEPIWEDTQDEVVSGEGEEMNRKDNGLSRFGHLFSSSNMEENIVNQSEPTALSRDTSGLYCPKENGSAGERFKDVQKSPPKRHLSGCGDTEDSNKSLKAEERCTFSGKPSTVFPFGARQPEGYSQLRNKADQPPVSAPPGFPAPSITPGVHVKAPSGFHEPEIGPLRNPSPPPSDSVGISNPRPPLMTPLPVAVPPPGVLPGIPPTLFPPYPGYPTFPAYPFPGMFPYLPMPAMQSPVYMYSLQQVQHGMGKLSSSHSSEESGGEGNGYNSNRQKMTSYSGNTVDPTQAGPVQAASTAASSGIPTAANSSTVHTTPHMPSPAVHPICKNTNGSEDLQVTQQLANPRSNDGATAKNKETFDRSVSDRIQSFDGEKDPVPHRVTERTTGHSRWVGSRPSSVRHVRGRGEAVGGRLETSGAALEGDSKREPAKTGGLYNKMRSFKGNSLTSTGSTSTEQWTTVRMGTGFSSSTTAWILLVTQDLLLQQATFEDAQAFYSRFTGTQGKAFSRGRGASPRICRGIALPWKDEGKPENFRIAHPNICLEIHVRTVRMWITRYLSTGDNMSETGALPISDKSPSDVSYLTTVLCAIAVFFCIFKFVSPWLLQAVFGKRYVSLPDPKKRFLDEA
ncbi:hypothetical protein Bbelb_408810 [Branchiostoma belcheri]|nr:hypothetical protein Bbelb_408810 [Branchiostoma belcheri]